MGDGGHFERVSSGYGSARPPYPGALFRHLVDVRAIGPGARVLEVGAGTGQATRELLRLGCEVTAVEPGADLARQLRASAPGACVVEAVAEEVCLDEHAFDSVVAATALHWVDLETCLPRFHAALRPGGVLAVWRTIFGDPHHVTPFREAVAEIVGRRDQSTSSAKQAANGPPDPRPTAEELQAGGWFTLTETWVHPWSIDLDANQIAALFATFSDWSPAEVSQVKSAAERFGPTVREHYLTHLRVLRRNPAS